MEFICSLRPTPDGAVSAAPCSACSETNMKKFRSDGDPGVVGRGRRTAHFLKRATTLTLIFIFLCFRVFTDFLHQRAASASAQLAAGFDLRFGHSARAVRAQLVAAAQPRDTARHGLPAAHHAHVGLERVGARRDLACAPRRRAEGRGVRDGVAPGAPDPFRDGFLSVSARTSGTLRR